MIILREQWEVGAADDRICDSIGDAPGSAFALDG
jgi:hypothetical protein